MSKLFKLSIFVFSAILLFNLNSSEVKAGPVCTATGANYTCEDPAGPHGKGCVGQKDCATGLSCCCESCSTGGSTSGVTKEIIPNERGQKEKGDYTLNDFVQLAVNVAGFILSIVGSLTLLMFIYGGFMMLISAGSQEKVTKARGILVGAVIGLAIVFASYLIIGFLWHSLNPDISPTGWATSNFFEKK